MCRKSLSTNMLLATILAHPLLSAIGTPRVGNTSTPQSRHLPARPTPCPTSARPVSFLHGLETADTTRIRARQAHTALHHPKRETTCHVRPSPRLIRSLPIHSSQPCHLLPHRSRSPRRTLHRHTCQQARRMATQHSTLKACLSLSRVSSTTTPSRWRRTQRPPLGLSCMSSTTASISNTSPCLVLYDG
jgi:hypothetical protein